jgi:hypothetical protein
MTHFHVIDQTARHPTASRIIPYLKGWGELLDAEGVRLMVYNPRSLLAEVLPVYQREAA